MRTIPSDYFCVACELCASVCGQQSALVVLHQEILLLRHLHAQLRPHLRVQPKNNINFHCFRRLSYVQQKMFAVAFFKLRMDLSTYSFLSQQVEKTVVSKKRSARKMVMWSYLDPSSARLNVLLKLSTLSAQTNQSIEDNIQDTKRKICRNEFYDKSITITENSYHTQRSDILVYF